MNQLFHYLAIYRQRSQITELEYQFCRFLTQIAPAITDNILLAGLLAIRALQAGNGCLFLDRYAGLPVEAILSDYASSPRQGNPAPPGCLPDKKKWREELRGCLDLVGRPGEDKPLVFIEEQDAIYLYRYWEYETRLAEDLIKRASLISEVDAKILAPTLDMLFPPGEACHASVDWQKIAAITAALKKFTIISGGPGTGKTTTVVKIIALLELLTTEKPQRIGLAAPTGKAAGRLRESIEKLLNSGAIPAHIRGRIPGVVTTIHRLLGYLPHSPYFRHDRKNPLPLDVLVVDEASMIDLALMSKLLAAFPEEGRLILLGDKDQLASVEPGRVLADLCGDKKENGFSESFTARMEAHTPGVLPMQQFMTKASPLADSIVLLEKSYRFKSTGGIGLLAKAVRDGDGDGAMAALMDSAAPEVAWLHWPSAAELQSEKELLTLLREPVIEGYGPYFAAPSVAEAFTSFNHFRIFSPHREGPASVKAINRMVEMLLAESRFIKPEPGGGWYRGRPVLITRNSYDLGLYNGDTGLTFHDAQGRLFVHFPGGGSDCFRSYSPQRLQHYETAYAMTVHKSQGNEFDHIILILPPNVSKIVTRELLYTAITRARKTFLVIGQEGAFRQAIASPTERFSGLSALLKVS